MGEHDDQGEQPLLGQGVYGNARHSAGFLQGRQDRQINSGPDLQGRGAAFASPRQRVRCNWLQEKEARFQIEVSYHNLLRYNPKYSW